MPEQEPSTRSNGVLHRRNSSMPDFPDAIKGPRFIPAFNGGVSARQWMDDQGNVLAVLDIGPRGGIYDVKGMT